MRYLAFHERMTRGTFDFPIELYYIDAAHPRYEMPFHWHMECELILILEGSFSLSVDGDVVYAEVGDCVFVPSGVIHGGTPLGCTYECLVFDMERFLRDSAVCRQKYAAALGDSTHIETLFRAGSPAARVVDMLFENMEKEQPGYEFITTGLLWQFFGTVLRYRLYTPSAVEPPRTLRHAEQMKNVLRRIRRDYAAPLTLSDLAAEAGLAPKYLCRVFRQVTGRTPIDYLNYYRIECAAELLCTTADSVTDIALQCGFNDLSYFSRLFKRQKNTSAHSYRSRYAQRG